MNGLKRSRLGLTAAVAAAIAIGAGVLAASPVSAQTETIAVSSATAAPGAQVSVDMNALDIGAPGLGAWTIDITYDPAVLSAVSCSPAQGGVCNTAYGANTVRVSGASAMGVAGDNVLASITFQCEVEGSSSVTPVIDLLVDATIGDPQPLEATPQAGSITCTQLVPTATSGPTEEPAATATPSGGLPVAGTGANGTGGGTPYWLIAGLTGAGLAWLLAVVAGAGFATASGSGAAGPGATSPNSGTREKTEIDGIPRFVALRRRGRR
jgi:hypothetical protein